MVDGKVRLELRDVALAVGQISPLPVVFAVRTTHQELVIVLLVGQKARLLVVREACFINQKGFASHLDSAVLKFTTQTTLQA